MSKQIEQIQVRIDVDTKRRAKKVLDGLGLDISTAVKMMLKQVIFTGTLPYEIRDQNGYSLQTINEFKNLSEEARTSKKSYASGKALIRDLLK